MYLEDEYVASSDRHDPDGAKSDHESETLADLKHPE
jgi:hypothetical protein